MIKDTTSFHGLEVKPSNTRKTSKREAFRQFVRLLRSPTGITTDTHGRMRGASFYMDSKWQTLRPAENTSTPYLHPGLYADMKLAVEGRRMKAPSSRSVARWMAQDFWPTTQSRSYSALNNEHIEVFPYATDACNTFCVLKADLLRS